MRQDRFTISKHRINFDEIQEIMRFDDDDAVKSDDLVEGFITRSIQDAKTRRACMYHGDMSPETRNQRQVELYQEYLAERPRHERR